MKIISINIGKPKLKLIDGKEVLTASDKYPVPSAMLQSTHVEGDTQGDTARHGGVDMAACVYSYDHYPFWEAELGKPLTPGAFSENITISDICESEAHIGDIFRVGNAIVQISQPRSPCFKLAHKHNSKTLQALIHSNGYSGFYFRVLQPGMVNTNDQMELITPHPAKVSVAFANEVMYKHRQDVESLRRLLDVSELSESWRTKLSARL